jgi:hypothetical protein
MAGIYGTGITVVSDRKYLRRLELRSSNPAVEKLVELLASGKMTYSKAAET